jgi:hypothetical protein
MQRLSSLVFLLLLSLSLGLHWAAFQGVAWTKMLIERVPSDGLVRAMESTFDGQHPCRWCQAVRKGHSESQRAEYSGSDHRMDLLPAAVFSVILGFPETSSIQRLGSVLWNEWVNPPDVPPPRVA